METHWRDVLHGAAAGPPSSLELHASIGTGLPFSWLVAVADALQMSARDLGVDVLQIPERTLLRRRQEGVLSATESDRLYRVARLCGHARRVFGTAEHAAVWTKRPQLTLGGHRPLDLLATDAGTQLVDDALGRIEYGIVA